jgi:hypothetical protein
MIASSMKRANSSMGHYKRVSAPKFDPVGDNDEFFGAYAKAEKEYEKTRAGDKTLGLRRAGFVGSQAVTSGFTLPSVKKQLKKNSEVVHVDDSPPNRKRRRESEFSSQPQKKVRTGDFTPGNSLSSLLTLKPTPKPQTIISISDSPLKTPAIIKNSSTNFIDLDS